MADNTTNRDDSVGEEIAATGQRVKGAVKDVTGSMLGLDCMEREGERENAEGRARQGANDALGDDRVTTRNTSGMRATGLDDSPSHAGRAYQDLTTRHGYTSEDVSVLMSDNDTRARHFSSATPGREFETASPDEAGSKAAEGAGIGGATGLGVGAAVGALLAAAIVDCDSRSRTRRRWADRWGHRRRRCGRRRGHPHGVRSARDPRRAAKAYEVASAKAASSSVRGPATRRMPPNSSGTSPRTAAATSFADAVTGGVRPNG